MFKIQLEESKLKLIKSQVVKLNKSKYIQELTFNWERVYYFDWKFEAEPFGE